MSKQNTIETYGKLASELKAERDEARAQLTACSERLDQCKCSGDGYETPPSVFIADKMRDEAIANLSVERERREAAEKLLLGVRHGYPSGKIMHKRIDDHFVRYEVPPSPQQST